VKKETSGQKPGKPLQCKQIPSPGPPAPSWVFQILTRYHTQMYRVAEAGLDHLAPVLPAVIDLGLKLIAGLDLGWDWTTIVEPLGGMVPKVVGPLAPQCHAVFLEHLDPWRLKFHHSLRESC
jgi:hypothetical protein